MLFVLLGTVFEGAETNLLSYPLPYVADSLHVSTTAVVGVISAQNLASLAGGFILGWMGDGLGRKRSFVLCVLLYGLGTILAAFTNYEWFMVTRIVAGIGIGGLFGLGFAMFAECWKFRRRGLMGGVVQATQLVGQLVTTGVVYACLAGFGHATGWRSGFLVIGVLSVLIAVAAAIWLPESRTWLRYRAQLKNGTLPEEAKRSKVPLLDLFRHGMAGGTLGATLMTTGLFVYAYTFNTFASTFLLKVVKISLADASLFLALSLIVTIASYLLCALLSDILKRRAAFVVSVAIGGVAAAAYLVVQFMADSGVDAGGFWSSPICWILFLAYGGWGGFGLLGVWMSELYPTRIRTTGSNSVYYAGRGIGSGLYPLGASAVTGGDAAVALGLCGVGTVASLVGCVFVPDRSGREIRAIE